MGSECVLSICSQTQNDVINVNIYQQGTEERGAAMLENIVN